MKNLRLFLNAKIEIPHLKTAESITFSNKSKSTDFVGTDEVLYLIKDGLFWCVSLADGSHKSASLSTLYPPDVTPVVSMSYQEFSDQFFTFHRGGEIYAFRVDFNKGTMLGRLIERIDDGITAVEWSPDEEFSVIVNEKNELFLLTSSCDVVNCWYLQDETEGEQKFINVGWGKKETQFQGSAGKAAAFAKPDQIDSASVQDDHSVKIKWRGDSGLFAVSYWCTNESRRKIKIFNRDAVLQCSGENMNGLEEPLAWRPQGNLLAMIQRLPNKYVVAFMEKNGLKHHDFVLPDGLKALDLAWNQDSQILCTTCFNSTLNQFVLLFWITRNYHWYLKQSFVCSDKPLSLIWDSKRENRVKVALEDGAVHILEFIWVTDHSGYSQCVDESFVSVIDDNKLLVTQFSVAVVPPPMAMWTLEFGSRVKQVCYPQQKSRFCIAAICEDGISFVSQDQNQNLIIEKSAKYEDRILSSSVLNWIWMDDETFVCLETVLRQSSLVIVELSDDGLNVKEMIPLNAGVVSMLPSERGLLLGASDGSFVCFDLTAKKSAEQTIDSFPEMCLDCLSFKNKLIGLSESSRLYINNVHVASNISSFVVAHRFLIATTSLHNLLFLKITDEKCEEVSRRKLENGSKLVLTTGTSVVLQLPRGNLETIQPRALNFVWIGSLLDQERYGEAVATLRKNRILLDVAIDHNPEAFLANVSKFVEQVDPHSLLVLVTEMSATDVTTTTYSSFYNRKDTASLQDKILSVCSALLNEMSKGDRANDFLLPRLSCLVKMNMMNDAFSLADSDQALQHLVFLVPVEKLYSSALEAYNLPVALKIASKSQMDPKEYVPYLNGLREMDLDYMKFTIDNSLKKYPSALAHLVNCGKSKEEECFSFIKDHSLYKHALKLIAFSDERYTKFASFYGEYLYGKRFYEEAGCMFYRAGDSGRAVQAFTASSSWQRALSLAKQHLSNDQEFASLGKTLREKLLASGSFKDAGILSEIYLRDYGEAIEAYIQGNLWEEALLVASVHRLDMSGTIKARIVEHANHLISEVKSKMEAILKYAERLKIVRIEKANKPRFQDFDAMSDTSSVSSRSGTSQGSRSSKMTRKASRKLWSLKEGNPREEEALLSALREIYLTAENHPVEVRKVCSVLLYVELDDLALQLQCSTREYLLTLQKFIPHIWPKDPNDEPTSEIDALIRCPPDFHPPSQWELDSIS